VVFEPEGENATVVSCLFTSGGSVWTHPLYLRLLPSNSHSALLCIATARALLSPRPLLSARGVLLYDQPSSFLESRLKGNQQREEEEENCRSVEEGTSLL
jgi:hypothetical protein